MKMLIIAIAILLFASVAWSLDVVVPRIASWRRIRTLARASRPDADAVRALIDLLFIEATFEVEVRGVTVHLHVVRFDCSARDSEIVAAFLAHAFRRGTPEELRVLASEHADALPIPLIAFGPDDGSDDRSDAFFSLEDSDEDVPPLARRDEIGRWPGYCRFLAANRPNPS
jgi:hypothetical protein